MTDQSVPIDTTSDADGARAALENASFEASAWLAAVVQNSDDAILSKTLDGTITTWNAGATRLFGYTADEALGQPVTILIPEDRLSEEDHILGRLRAGDRVEHFETVRRRKDGSLLDVSLTVSPVRNAAGAIIGASKIARDITELKQSRNGQAILLREMNHRIKNLFSLFGGLVMLSARSAESTDTFAAGILSRLEAMALAQELTLPDPGDDDATEKSTTLFTLLATILEPYRHAEASRVSFSGDDVPLYGTALTSIALLFHEIATNAAKYGALSTPAGSIVVAMQVEDGRLVVDWFERGGPAIAGEPSSSGFGSVLEKATIRGLRGAVARHWEPAGLHVQLSFPVERLGG